MPRSLADLASSLAANDDRPPSAEKADDLADALAALRPGADRAAVRAAAYDAVGVPLEDDDDEPQDEPAARPARSSIRRPSTASKWSAKAGRRAGTAARRLPASSPGRLFRLGAKLAILYWLLNHAAGLAAIITGPPRFLRWLFDPAAIIGQRGADSGED